MARLFTGDFSTGTLQQWSQIQSTGPAAQASGVYAAVPGRVGRGLDHTLTVVPARDAGYVARFELRETDDDDPDGQLKQRTELYTAHTDKIGATRWLAWSWLFDSNHLTDPMTYSWWNLFQTGTVGSYLPITSWGWSSNPPASGASGTALADHVQLFVCKYADTTYVGNDYVYNLPMNRGVWTDIKMQVKWSRGDDGFIKLWVNGQPQTLLGGTETYTGPTALGGDDVNYKIGMYRDKSSVWPAAGKTASIQYRNFRIADTEDSL